MKKLVLGAAFAIGLAVVANAQQSGDVNLNAGIGFDSASATPVYVGADYFVTDDISAGGRVSYLSNNEKIFIDPNNSVDYSFSAISIGANGNYHFNRLLTLPSEWDLYGGLNLTYTRFSIDEKYKSYLSTSNTNFGGQIGARYFFSPNFGANVEFGGGSNVSGGFIGITYKL